VINFQKDVLSQSNLLLCGLRHLHCYAGALMLPLERHHSEENTISDELKDPQIHAQCSRVCTKKHMSKHMLSIPLLHRTHTLETVL